MRQVCAALDRDDPWSSMCALSDEELLRLMDVSRATIASLENDHVIRSTAPTLRDITGLLNNEGYAIVDLASDSSTTMQQVEEMLRREDTAALRSSPLTSELCEMRAVLHASPLVREEADRACDPTTGADELPAWGLVLMPVKCEVLIDVVTRSHAKPMYTSLNPPRSMLSAHAAQHEVTVSAAQCVVFACATLWRVRPGNGACMVWHRDGVHTANVLPLTANAWQTLAWQPFAPDQIPTLKDFFVAGSPEFKREYANAVIDHHSEALSRRVLPEQASGP